VRAKDPLNEGEIGDLRQVDFSAPIGIFLGSSQKPMDWRHNVGRRPPRVYNRELASRLFHSNALTTTQAHLYWVSISD